MLKTLERVETVALEARQAFEARAVPRTLLKELYGRYNPTIRDIDDYVARAEILFPYGNCGLTSVYLQHQLGAGEVWKGSYLGDSHTFLDIGHLTIAETIMDITADQFGGPAVYIGPLVLPWRRENELT